MLRLCNEDRIEPITVMKRAVMSVMSGCPAGSRMTSDELEATSRSTGSNTLRTCPRAICAPLS